MSKTKTATTDLRNLSKAELIDRIIALELLVAKLLKNSNNSSKPPSADFHKPDKPPSHHRNSRNLSDKKTGGQPGHHGTTRVNMNEPDETLVCAPLVCKGCGSNLEDPTSQSNVETVGTAQTIDIPPIVPVITEFQKLQVTCGCGHVNTGQYPPFVSSRGGIQLGPNVSSFLVYLSTAHHMPYQRLQELTSNILNLEISQGTIRNKLNEAAAAARPVKETILQFLHDSPWVGSDETGTRVTGKRWWEWVWQNSSASYYTIAPSRSYQIIKQYFGESYRGSLIHDCLSAQNMTVARFHQLCHAHLFRDLQFLIDTGEDVVWAYQLKRLLYKSQRARDHCWSEWFDPGVRATIIKSYQEQLSAFLVSNLSSEESKKLQKRLLKHQDKLLHFMSSPDIPPDNNGSERAIRNAKIKQKVSGGFRSEAGATHHATLLSVIETAKKQNLNVLTVIQQLMSGKPVRLFEGE